MTIRAELYDAGTTLIKVPWGGKPGMELAYFREIDMEYDFTQDDYRIGEINDALLATEAWVDLAPWPQPFPGVMWVDYTPRYYGEEGPGGLQLTMYHWYAWGDDENAFNPVPAKLSQMSRPDFQVPFADRTDERMGDSLTQEEIQERNDHPTKWLRLPTRNETGMCELLQPAALVQRGQVGASFGLASNYNPLFFPFDLRRPEYYSMVTEDGTTVSEETKIQHMRLMADGFYRLYLVPARWRWVATVAATFVYISWFEAFYTREVFTHAWFNRPPIYPIRHNVLTTSQYPGLEYNFNFYCSDLGVNDGFDRSRGSAFLRQQIIEAQWYTMSEVYLFVGNDPVTLTLWQYPPEPGDVVLGIGKMDSWTGSEERLWLIQKQSVADRWPNTVIAQYLVPFIVTI
jgi:hypothetical protein